MYWELRSFNYPNSENDSLFVTVPVLYIVSVFDAIYCWDNKMKEQILSNIFHLKLIPLYYNNLIGPFSSLKTMQTIVSSSACWKILKTFSEAVTLLENISSLREKPLKLYLHHDRKILHTIPFICSQIPFTLKFKNSKLWKSYKRTRTSQQHWRQKTWRQ